MPIGYTVGVVAPVLARHGSLQLREEWLPRIASGETMASAQDGWGQYAPWAASCGLVLVPESEQLHVCSPAVAAATPRDSVDRARLLGQVGPAAVIETIDDPRAAAEVRQRAATVASAELLGVAHALVARTVEYVKVRHQFSRPVGSFQAVQHLLSDAFLQVEAARRTTWVAMGAIEDGGPAAARSVAVTKVLASEAAKHASQLTLQLHGGIGYTWELGLHMWLKRVQALSAEFGEPSDYLVSFADRIATGEPDRESGQGLFGWS
jgi:alkylation response protein AidB-like acyl-CoA dehydrogenase